jgi:flavin-dependent thymidylate synthase
MLLSFDIEPDNEDQVSVCHNDGNSLNNTLDNLRWGTPKENSEDMVTHGTSTELSHVPAKIVSITYDGEEMTYDLEVEGPYHNFSANNIVVHNSINEYSTRYMEALDHFQITPADEWRLQSKSNKQGSKSYITDWPDLEEDSYISTNMLDAIDCGVVPEEYLTNTEQDLHTHIRNVYKERLKLGISREQARKDLPLSTMTRAYWKCDLHNIFHFLNLRMDEHAQYEIRSYAHCMFNIVSELFPIASQAFKDYRLDAVTFSRMEMECIKKIPDCYHHLIENGKPHNMTDNEWTAFLKKLS